MREGVEYVIDPYRRRYIALALDSVKEIFGDSLISCVLYGSLGRGGDDKPSDTDLLLVLDTCMSYSERCDMLGKMLAKLYTTDLAYTMARLGYNIFIEFYPLSVEEALVFRPIYLDMVEDAVILYDKDGFFKSILAKTRSLLSKLGSRRVWIDRDRWVWILKPDISFGEEIRYELE
ncbi:MAG: nucleotidyltransferase domain-containing protein [Candidatus Bathyarchaeota archaeon]|nr:nucleotidyltransferase domain-containing protein [Candidatus Bathyarchaeota archaeon]